MNKNDKSTVIVLRGGSWLNIPVICRSANRDGSDMDGVVSDVGLRVIYDPKYSSHLGS